MYPVFRNDIYAPFINIGLSCLLLSYIAFLIYNVVTPGYLIEGFFTNPSFFIGLQSLALYLVLIGIGILFIAAGIYAYIEVGRYTQQITYLTEERKTLEVRLPEDVQETLSAMEAVLETIAIGGGEGLWFPVWWNGKKRPVFSFEIISKGGIVSFLINTRASLAHAVMSAIYAFYPKAQVSEVDDYTHDFEFDEEEVGIYPFEWKLKENSPLPIKTYVEFQLERYPGPTPFSSGGQLTRPTQLEPTRPLVDPLAPLYDFFGSISGDEQLWVQYVFRTQKNSRPVESVADDPIDPEYWNKQKLPDEIQEALVALEKKVKQGREAGAEPEVLSAAERRLQAIGPRLIEKQALEVGVRMLYVAPKESFDPTRIPSFGQLYKLMDSDENALKAFGTLRSDVYEIPPLEPPRYDKKAESHLLLQLYRDRLFWFAPALFMYQAKDAHRWSKEVGDPSKPRLTSVMTTETLATICHFPTSYIRTPTVKRVISTKVEPPENLPV